MAKKSSSTRKPSGAAGIKTVESDLDDDTFDKQHESNGSESDRDGSAVKTSSVKASAVKPKRAAQVKTVQPASGNVEIGDIKKAAAFANSIGGLDKAIAVLQILKVAKEVQ